MGVVKPLGCLSAPKVIVAKELDSGQAALLSLLLLPAAVLGLLLIFNTGQSTAAKIKVQNAADAAAFSAMEMQARQMNLDAYVNRASIANEAAIGQAVSLLSWGRFANTSADNIGDVLSYLKTLPFVGSVFAGAGLVVKLQGRLAYGATTAYALTYLPQANMTDAALAGGQSAFNGALFLNGGGFVAPILEQVVKLNDPQARLVDPLVFSMAYSAARRKFVGGVGSGKEKQESYARQASLIMDSADEFTKIRARSLGRPMTANVGIAKWNSAKEGGSQFALKDPADPDSGYIWSGMDTVHTDVYYRRYGIFGGWRRTFGKSWGYGGAFSKPDTSQFDYYESMGKDWTQAYVDPNQPANQKQLAPRIMPVYQGNWDKDRRGAYQVVRDYPDRVASDLAPPVLSRGNLAGIAPFRDLVNRAADNADDAPSYIAVVEHPLAAVRDSVTALGISHPAPAGAEWTDLRLQSAAAHGQSIRAAAKAQVYFRRPASLWPRLDGLDERANLYSPFWSARLVDLTAAERLSIQSLP